RTTAVPSHDGRNRSQQGTHAIAGNSHPGGIDTQLLSVLMQPDERCITVLLRRAVAVLRQPAVLHACDQGPGLLREPCRNAIKALDAAETEAAPVEVTDGGTLCWCAVEIQLDGYFLALADNEGREGFCFAIPRTAQVGGLQIGAQSLCAQ